MQSREPRVRECTERAKTHLADDFIMHAASEEFLWEVIVEGAPPGTTKRAVVYNTFNDVVGQTTGMLKKCYARILGDAEAAEMLAVRDMLDYWKLENEEMSAALRRLAVRAWRERGMDVRVWYRTSPPTQIFVWRRHVDLIVSLRHPAGRTSAGNASSNGSSV